MKRNELKVGEAYAYRTSKYGTPVRAIVVDTEPVERVNGNHQKDSVRLVFPDGRYGFGGGISRINEERYEAAVKFQETGEGGFSTYSAQRAIDLYDGKTWVEVNGEDREVEILRGQPRYLKMTWAEWEQREIERRERDAKRRADTADKAEQLSESISELPEAIQKFFRIDRTQGRAYSMPYYEVEALIEELLNGNGGKS
jgi:hypothetical protein